MSDDPTQPGHSVFGDPGGRRPSPGRAHWRHCAGRPDAGRRRGHPPAGTDAVHYDVPPQPPLRPTAAVRLARWSRWSLRRGEEEPPWFQRTSVIVAIVLVLVLLIGVAVAVFASGGDDDSPTTTTSSTSSTSSSSTSSTTSSTTSTTLAPTTTTAPPTTTTSRRPPRRRAPRPRARRRPRWPVAGSVARDGRGPPEGGPRRDPAGAAGQARAGRRPGRWVGAGWGRTRPPGRAWPGPSRPRRACGCRPRPASAALVPWGAEQRDGHVHGHEDAEVPQQGSDEVAMTATPATAVMADTMKARPSVRPRCRRPRVARRRRPALHEPQQDQRGELRAGGDDERSADRGHGGLSFRSKTQATSDAVPTAMSTGTRGEEGPHHAAHPDGEEQEDEQQRRR